MSGDLGVSATFTDLDLYETMQRHLPMIFWPTWEAAGQEVRAGVARIANDVYGRLCGPERPHEKPADTESAGSGHPQDAEAQFRADELKRLHRNVGRALMDILYGSCPRCGADKWYLRMPEREWQCGSCKFIVEMAEVKAP